MTKPTYDNRENLRVALTIGGSDSGGGAGIQADLKTFSAFGVFGTSSLTCLTAQNPDEVRAIQAVDAAFVREQIEAVCDSFPINAAKTGMLYSAEIIRAVAHEDIHEGLPILVVDPVMVAASGARLLQADAIEALCESLLPLARVVTPNLHEAEILCGHSIANTEELRAAARDIGERFDLACVCKGGHLPGDEIVDVLYDEGEEHVYTSSRIPAPETHGAGCAFSAAVTAMLARGSLLSEAVKNAKGFVVRGLEQSLEIGKHHPLNFFCDVEEES
jgi:hydroxymethylpyrimidine/phosphomethylpyrimidine kinase